MKKASMFEMVKRWWKKEFPLCKDCLYCKREGAREAKCVLKTVTDWNYVFPAKEYYQDCWTARDSWCGKRAKYFQSKG